MEDHTIPYIQRSRANFWIITGLYLSIFLVSKVFFKQPFEFYIGYLVYILLLPKFFRKHHLNINLIYVFAIILITGILGVVTNHNTVSQFVKIYLGVLMSYLFYYYAILELDLDIEQLFKWYLKLSYIACLIGLFQLISFIFNFSPGYDFRTYWFLNKWGLANGGFFGIRINSIFPEPAHLGSILSAACFISMYNLISKQPYYLSKFKSIIIISVYFLSFSTLAQTGIFLSILFLGISFGLVRYLILIVPILTFVSKWAYNNVFDFRDRVDGLVSMFTTGHFELGITNGSSFILYNNYVVAIKNFKTNVLFGTGLGSHPIAFQKYSLAKNIMQRGFDLNSDDANSMLLRLISETGIFGVGLFMWLIFSCYVKRDKNYLTYHWLVSNSILIMILLNLFRQGHYFLLGFPFFVLLYYFNSVSYKNYKQEHPIDLY